MKRIALLFAASLACAHAGAGDIVFAVFTSTGMPMTAYRGQELVDGWFKQFGDALAAEMRLTPHYVVFPRKRVEEAIHRGEADLLCDLRPEWLERKDWLWSDAMLNNTMIVASRADTPVLTNLAALRRRRLGTILGYRYHEVEQALGSALVRDEGSSDDANLSKLLHRRFDYMLTNSFYFDYQRKAHAQGGELNAARFTVKNYDTYCALSPSGKISVAGVNLAIAALRHNGTMQRLQDHFRPASDVPPAPQNK